MSRIKAIMNQLITGSIVKAYTRGNYQTYLSGKSKDDTVSPYVVVYDDFPIDSYYKTIKSVQSIVIDAHYTYAYIDELNTYIEEEVIGLLHRQVLTTGDGNVFQIIATMNKT